MIFDYRFKAVLISGLLAAGVLSSGYARASVVMLGETVSAGYVEDGSSGSTGLADSGLVPSSDSVRIALLSVMSDQSTGYAGSKNFPVAGADKFNVRNGEESGNQHGPYSIEEGEDGTGGGSQLIESVPAVPLPAGVWLMLSGMAGLMLTMRRKVAASHSV